VSADFFPLDAALKNFFAGTITVSQEMLNETNL